VLGNGVLALVAAGRGVCGDEVALLTPFVVRDPTAKHPVVACGQRATVLI
jgi:hypothetical protein